MSQTSELMGAGRTDILPGRSLSPLRIDAIAEAEQWLQYWHVTAACYGLDPAPDDDPATLAAKSADRVAVRVEAAKQAQKHFKWGTDAFTDTITSKRGQFLTIFLSMRHGATPDNKMTLPIAEEIISKSGITSATMFEFVLWYWGFEVKKNPPAAGSPLPSPNAASESSTVAPDGPTPP